MTNHVNPKEITPVKGHKKKPVIANFNTISPTKVAQNEVQTVHSSILGSFLLILPNKAFIGLVKRVTGHSSPFSTRRIDKEHPKRTDNIM